MDSFKLVLLVALSTLIAACSAPKYASLKGKDSAKISFTSTSDRLPELALNLRGKSYSINPDMIDIAKPASNQVFDIPANEVMLLTYTVSEAYEHIVTPIMKNHVTTYVDSTSGTDSTNPTVASQLDFELKTKLNNCSTQFAFIPAKGKNYEAFIEQSDGILCRVYIREVITSPGDKHNTYKLIKSIKPVVKAL